MAVHARRGTFGVVVVRPFRVDGFHKDRDNPDDVDDEEPDDDDLEDDDEDEDDEDDEEEDEIGDGV